MNTMSVRTVFRPDDPALAEVPALFEAMHAEMAEQGMGLRLVPDGGRVWLDGAALPVCHGARTRRARLGRGWQ